MRFSILTIERKPWVAIIQYSHVIEKVPHLAKICRTAASDFALACVVAAFAFCLGGLGFLLLGQRMGRPLIL